ncbi:MAG: hypothetical protein WCP77_04845 [Roseococcus sp.]
MKVIPRSVKTGALFAALLALFWSGLFHLHPPIGWVDPGLYIYWFLYAPDNTALRVTDYHGARLSYVVPGFLLYRIFEPVLAQKILVSGYYLLGLCALHLFAGSLLHGFRARALLVILVAANPLWIGAFARGYVDGPCMALGLLALSCLLRPSAPPGAWRHAAAGALLALALCAHTLGGGMAGLAAAAIALIRADTLRRLLGAAAAGLAGAAACLGVLGLVAMAIGMPFLFVRAFWAPLRLSIDGTYDAFSLPATEWLPFTPRLLLLPIIFGLLLAAWNTIRAEGRRGWAMAAAVLVPLLPLLAWFFRTASLMQFHFYASYLQLSLVPALVLLLARLESKGRLADSRALAVPVAGVVLIVGLGAFLPMEWRLAWPFALGTWVVAGGAVMLAVILGALARPRPALAAFALGLVLTGSLNADTARAYRLPGTPDQAAQHAGLVRLHEFLAASGGLRGRYVLWFARDSFTQARALGDGSLYDLGFAGTRIRLNALDSLGASLGWHVAAIGFSMPAFAERWGLDQASTIGADPVTLVTLCAEPQECREGAATLIELGLTVEPGPAEAIEVPGMPPFAVGRARLRAEIEAPAPRDAQLEAILARLERLDAAAAALGAPPLSPEARAGSRPASLPSAPVPRVLAANCTREGARITCQVRYAPPDGTPLRRHLAFTAIVHLALLTEAGPAELDEDGT